MNRFSSFPRIALIAALLFIAVGVPRVSAQEARWTAEYTAVLAGMDPPLLVFALEGQATLMGPFTGESHDFVTRNGTVDGITVFEAIDGSTLVQPSHLDPVGKDLFVGTFAIEGGTGRFEGATGGGTIVLMRIAPGVFEGMREGTLSISIGR